MKPFATKACLRQEISYKEEDASLVRQTSKEIVYVTDEAEAPRGGGGRMS